MNKEYDNDGNLIRYDSVYTSLYSNFKGDSTDFEDFCSQFYPHFQGFYPDLVERYFNDMFFIDSLRGYDFYKDDFFSKRVELYQGNFTQLFNLNYS